MPEPDAQAWLQGRLAWRIAAYEGQPARSESASFELRGDSARGELRLATPLGSVLAVARWSPLQASLATPQGEARFDSLAELSRRVLGEELPLQALPDWLQGRPWPTASHRSVDGGFDQLGWRIDLARLADGLITAMRDEPPPVEIRIRIER